MKSDRWLTHTPARIVAGIKPIEVRAHQAKRRPDKGEHIEVFSTCPTRIFEIRIMNLTGTSLEEHSMSPNLKQIDVEHQANKTEFIPYRTDVVFRAFNKVARNNPLYAALLCFLVSFVGLYLVGILTGQFYGKNGVSPMYTQSVDIINLAFLVPVGTGLLCNLYNNIFRTIMVLKTEGVVSPGDAADLNTTISRLESLLNNMPLIIGAILISLAINVYNYFQRVDSWVGVNAGLTGIYGRLVIILSYFMIGVVTHKCIVTVWFMRKALNYDIVIQPMHPDRAGGLRSIGRLSVAVNYFLGLIIIFFSLLIMFHPNARQQPLYLLIFVLFYILAPILLFLSLSKAYKKMAAKKKEALDRLGITFNYYYEKLSRSSGEAIYDIQSADEISKVYRLYEIVDKMPVWPFDVKSVMRFFATITLPLVVFLLQLLTDTGSILYNLDKLKLYFK